MVERAAGWYPDPSGQAAQRYWDGSEWTDHVDGFPPPPSTGGHVRPAHTYPRTSQAGWSLGLSIFGLMCCGPVAIAGMVMGRSEVSAIDRGEADPSQRGIANAGFIVGLVGTVLWVFAILTYLVLLALLAG